MQITNSMLEEPKSEYRSSHQAWIIVESPVGWKRVDGPPESPCSHRACNHDPKADNIIPASGAVEKSIKDKECEKYQDEHFPDCTANVACR
jgi:hypothetical protein